MTYSQPEGTSGAFQGHVRISVFHAVNLATVMVILPECDQLVTKPSDRHTEVVGQLRRQVEKHNSKVN
jgi:hypothetical protein